MAGQEQRIVVGIDGSDSSKAALRWALRQAKLTGAAIDAVIAWQYPSAYGWAPIAADGLDLAGDARKVLEKAVAEVAGRETDVLVRAVVAEGHPAEVVLKAARDASLLVVGSRGHGGLASAVIGSVSLNCVLHARCPVLVLHEGHEHEQGQREQGSGLFTRV